VKPIKPDAFTSVNDTMGTGTTCDPGPVVGGVTTIRSAACAALDELIPVSGGIAFDPSRPTWAATTPRLAEALRWPSLARIENCAIQETDREKAMYPNRISHALAAATTAAGILVTPMLGAPVVAAPTESQAAAALPCGWYRTNHDPASTSSRYRHCADSFIMIRVHWSNGHSNRLCVEPWENVPFWPDGGYEVTNAHYIPDRPRVLTTPDGRRLCAASQYP
jgi:hypothetical protein